MGDMNISPTDLDIGIGEENRKRWLRTGKCSFLPEEREWMERLLGWGLVDTYRHAWPEKNDQFRGLITAQKALTITVACVSICCWRANRWRSAAKKPASTMKSAAWKSRPTMRLYGLNSASDRLCIFTLRAWPGESVYSVQNQ